MKTRHFCEDAKTSIQGFVNDFLHFLKVQQQVNYHYERVGQGTFFETMTGAVNRAPFDLVVNIDWYENTNEYDISMILRHEARHLYQRDQVNKLEQNDEILESLDVVKQWKANFTHYIIRTPFSEIAYFKQPIEMDANFYTFFIDTVASMNIFTGAYSVSVIDYPGVGDALAAMVDSEIEKKSVEELRILYAFFRQLRQRYRF